MHVDGELALGPGQCRGMHSGEKGDRKEAGSYCSLGTETEHTE